MEKKVFVNGTFDVLHIGHVRLLNYAKSLGSHLIVAVDSNRRVSEKKGISRPINELCSRVEFLFNLKAVDIVRTFDSDEELEELVKVYSPDVMVVGSDYKEKKVIGSEFAKSLIFYERIEPFSSTRTLQRLIDR